MHKIKEGECISNNGYHLLVSYYHAKRAERYPLRSACHKAKGNRIIEVKPKINYYKKQASEKLLNLKKQLLRNKLFVKKDALFAQLKSNNKLNRFSFGGSSKENLEFTLLAIWYNLKIMLSKSFENRSLALKNFFQPNSIIIKLNSILEKQKSCPPFGQSCKYFKPYQNAS